MTHAELERLRKAEARVDALETVLIDLLRENAHQLVGGTCVCAGLHRQAHPASEPMTVLRALLAWLRRPRPQPRPRVADLLHHMRDA